MKTVFIKRYISNGELPKEDNENYLTNKGLLKFEKGKWYSWWQANQYTPEYPNYYLEEIELHSEEEIEQEEHNNFIQSDRNHYFKDGFKTGANFILNKLKGETKL